MPVYRGSMEHIFQSILVLLSFSVVTVWLFRRIAIPPVLGYLTVGLLVGPHLFGLVEQSIHTQHIAKYGVVFLLFTVGLEFSLPQLMSMKTTVLGFGGLQVLLTSIAGAVTALALGANYTDAIIVGGIVAMSSTAIVIKQLTEQLELNSRHGRNSLGILIFQDLAVIPFLIFLPLLRDDTSHSLLTPLLIAFLKGLITFTLLLAMGRWLLRPLFREIAATRSTELFMLTVLLVTLAAAWLTHLMGLSAELGAFLAGAMLGETEFRHQIEANIRPFRDILLGLFFITIGMMLNLSLLTEIWYAVILLLAALIAGKLLIIIVLGWLFRIEAGVAMRTGLVLAQGGEFGFAILSLAINDRLISTQTGQLMLLVIVMSMMIAPILIRHNGDIVKRLFHKSYVGQRRKSESIIEARTRDLKDHVIICGYGRVGQNIARFLDIEGIPFIALDTDPYLIREANEAGDNICFGDATHRDILKAANIGKCRALVLAFDDENSALKVLEHARENNKKIPILVRASGYDCLDKLLQHGATEVVPEKLEASLVLVSHLLSLLDVDPEEIKQRIDEVRADKYLLLRSFFHGDSLDETDLIDGTEHQLSSIVLPKDAAAIGKTIGELNLPEKGITITAIKRGNAKTTKPNTNMVLSENDVLIVFGRTEDIEHARSVLL